MILNNYHTRDQLFKNIQNSEIVYPSSLSTGAISLMKGLLNKKQLLRLGAGKDDASEIKNHPYFKGWDWNALYLR